MGLAILSVILFHQMFINGFPFTVLHRYGKWAVDVFMLLSGIGVVQSIRKYPPRVIGTAMIAICLSIVLFDFRPALTERLLLASYAFLPSMKMKRRMK